MIRMIDIVIILVVAYCSKTIVLAQSPQGSDPSNKLLPFGPFAWESYTIEGIWDPKVEFTASTGHLIGDGLRGLNEHKPPNERTKRGAGWVGYQVTSPTAEVKFTWKMRGVGTETMTYAECTEAIQGLQDYIVHHADENQHPIHADISKTGGTGVLITVDINFIQGQSQTFDMGPDLEFRGRFLPNRIMPREDLQVMLRRMKDDMDSRGSAAVPIPWQRPDSQGSLTTIIAMLSPIPGVTIPFTTIANLFGALQAFYNVPGAKQGVLAGQIWKKPSTPNPICVGVFNILLESHEFPPFRTLGELGTGTSAEE